MLNESTPTPVMFAAPYVVKVSAARSETSPGMSKYVFVVFPLFMFLIPSMVAIIPIGIFI